MDYDRTLIRIRERSFLDQLDLALVVLRRRPLTLGLAALAGVAPCVAFNAWLAYQGDVPFMIGILLLILEVPWATAPLTVVLGGMMFGERLSSRQVFMKLVRSFPALVIYQIVVRGALMCTVFFYPIVPARLAFLDEVILLERGGMNSALRRSSILCGRQGFDFFGRWVAQVSLGALFVAFFWAGTGAMVNSLTTSELTWDTPGWADLSGLRFQLALWLAVSYFGVARFLSYIDQRIRIEGWELKLRLQAVGRSLEEGSRW